jgi:hypothetical protein
MSCSIPNVVSFTGLYILCLSSSYVLLYAQCCLSLDCTFWIVFLLFPVIYPMLSVSLDCTFCVCLPRMYNPEKLTTLGMQQDIRRRHTQNVQSRETDNIGYTTRHKRKTNTECTICSMPNVVCLKIVHSGLSSSYFLLYTQCCQFLRIVHSVFVFLLCPVVYPMLSVSLDCTFCVCLPLQYTM